LNLDAAASYPISRTGTLTILIIDDEPALRELLCLTFELQGHTVLSAANGSDGCEIALRQQPDIILCDVQMPGLSGHQVLQALRDDYQTRHIPFIFLTGCVEKQSIRLGMAGGAVEYLVKPCRSDELEEAIAACRSRLAFSEARTEFALAGVD
jgi:CheY-like chemotaxis protein